MKNIIMIVAFVAIAGFYFQFTEKRDAKLMTINYQMCEDIEGNFNPCAN